MMKTTTMLIIIVTVKSTAALPLTRPDDIIWSTPCRHDVDADLRPLHCTDTTGNDVTVDTKATRTTKSGNVTGRRVWTNYPFPYDPWLGWYIAAIISGLILTLVFCEGMDRVKHAVVDYLDARLTVTLTTRSHRNAPQCNATRRNSRHRTVPRGAVRCLALRFGVNAV